MNHNPETEKKPTGPITITLLGDGKVRIQQHTDIDFETTVEDAMQHGWEKAIEAASEAFHLRAEIARLQSELQKVAGEAWDAALTNAKEYSLEMIEEINYFEDQLQKDKAAHLQSIKDKT